MPPEFRTSSAELQRGAVSKTRHSTRLRVRRALGWGWLTLGATNGQVDICMILTTDPYELCRATSNRLPSSLRVVPSYSAVSKTRHSTRYRVRTALGLGWLTLGATNGQVEACMISPLIPTNFAELLRIASRVLYE